MSEDASGRYREAAGRVAAQRLALARAAEGGDEQRAARVRLAGHLMFLAQCALDAAVDADGDDGLSSPGEEVPALLAEIRAIVDDLLPVVPVGGAEHRSLSATLAAWTWADGWLRDDEDYDEVVSAAIALYEDALAPSTDSAVPDFDEDGVWDEYLADDARVALVELMSDYCDVELDAELYDRMVRQLELLAQAPVELDEAAAASRLTFLGRALAQRSRGPRFRTAANTADRERAIRLLRMALARPGLESELAASAQANLAQLLLAKDAARYEDDDSQGPLDEATTAQVLDLLEAALEKGAPADRGYALGLAVSVTARRCDQDPTLKNRQSVVDWCRRLLADPDADAADVGDARLILALELLNRSEGEWPELASGSGFPDEYPAPEHDEAEALGLLEQILDSSESTGNPESGNAEQDEDDSAALRVAALGGVVAILGRTSPTTMDAERLDRIIDRCDQLVRVIPTADSERGELFLRLGLALTERAKRTAGPRISVLIQQMIAYHLGRGEIAAGIAHDVPQAAADLDRAIDLLRLGSGLCDPQDWDYAGSLSVLALALILKFLVQLPAADRAVMREAIHWMRAAMQAAGDFGAQMLGDMRQLLALAMMQYLWKTEPFATLNASKLGSVLDVPDLTTVPSVEDDAQVLESLIDLDLKRASREGGRQEAVLVLMSAFLARMQGPHRQQDFLDRLKHVLELADDIDPDDVWAVMFARTVLALHHSSPGVEAALLTRGFLEQYAGFVGSKEFEFFPSTATDRPAQVSPPAEPLAAELQAGDPGAVADPDATVHVDPDAASLIGDGSGYPFALPVGRVLEVLDATATTQPAAAVIRAMAQYHRWLQGRDPQDFTDAVVLARGAARSVDGQSPLGLRIAAFLSGLLLDRYALLGDRADLEAARLRSTELLGHAREQPGLPDLPWLLTQWSDTLAGEQISSLFGRRLESGPFHAEMLAALGAAELLGATDQSGRSAAAALLAQAEALLPPEHPRRPAVMCELGCTEAQQAAIAKDPVRLTAAVEKVLDAADRSAGGPHRPALLLRAAAVLGAHGTATGLGSADRAARLLERGIALLDEAAGASTHEYLGARSRCQYGLGLLLHLRALRHGDRADLGRAAEVLEDARASLSAVPGDPFVIVLRRALAEVYRSHGSEDAANRRRSREAAAAVLAGQREAVMLQTGTRRGLEAARRAEQDMTRLVRWCLADGEWARAADALERGRGLVLNAATVAADVPSRLRATGHAELADRWAEADRSASGGGEAAGLTAIVDDLRRRVLHVLEGTADERHLLAVPTPGDIAAALRQVGADAFVYLIPGTEEEPGYALIVREKADGPDDRAAVEEIELPLLRDVPGGALAQYAAALGELHRRPDADAPARYGSRDTYVATRTQSTEDTWDEALERLCRWAGPAAVDQVLAHISSRIPGPLPRLVLAPAGRLGLVPWHAAYVTVPGHAQRRLCQDAVISHCATARQFADAAARPRPAPDGPRAMIVDPHGSPQMHLEARVIRSAFYPGSTVIGQLPWDSGAWGPWSGPAPVAASAQAVLPLLPGRGDGAAALLVANCHAAVGATPARSMLVLDSGRPPSTVTVEQLLANAHRRDARAPGGLVVLVDCDSDLALAQHDESMTLTTALLAAGAGAVIGARWLVEDSDRTTVLMFMFHHFLSGRGAPDAPRRPARPRTRCGPPSAGCWTRTGACRAPW